MSKLIDALRKLLAKKPEQAGEQRRDAGFVGRSSTKEIENASPERAGELAGHAVERVDT